MQWLSQVGLALGCVVCVVGLRWDKPRVGWCDSHPLTQRLVGTWRGDGELFGRPASSHMAWSCALGGKFLRLSFRNRFDGEDDAAIEAEAFYATPTGDSLDGSWFDSRGKALRLRAAIDDSILQTAWSGGGERGRTEYRLTTDGGVLVIDAVEAPRGWREFARAVYRKE